MIPEGLPTEVVLGWRAEDGRAVCEPFHRGVMEELREGGPMRTGKNDMRWRITAQRIAGINMETRYLAEDYGINTLWITTLARKAYADLMALYTAHEAIIARAEELVRGLVHEHRDEVRRLLVTSDGAAFDAAMQVTVVRGALEAATVHAVFARRIELQVPGVAAAHPYASLIEAEREYGKILRERVTAALFA